jgi:hypothetical protein
LIELTFQVATRMGPAVENAGKGASDAGGRYVTISAHPVEFIDSLRHKILAARTYFHYSQH